MRSTHVTVVALLAASLAGCGGRTSDHRRAPVPAPEVVEAGAGLGAWELFEPRFLTAVATHPGVSFALAKEAYVAIVHVAPDGSLTALHPTEAGRVEARGAGEHSVNFSQLPVQRPTTPATHAASSAEYHRCIEQARRNAPRPDRSATAPKDKDGRPIPIPSRPQGDAADAERYCAGLLRPSGAENVSARAAVRGGHLLLVAVARPISASELLVQVSTAQITANDIPTLMLSLGAHIAGDAKWSGIYRELR